MNTTDPIARRPRSDDPNSVSATPASDHQVALTAVMTSTGATTGWKDADGPHTGVGNEFFFQHRDHGIWYVCMDQGEVDACCSMG